MSQPPRPRPQPQPQPRQPQSQSQPSARSQAQQRTQPIPPQAQQRSQPVTTSSSSPSTPPPKSLRLNIAIGTALALSVAITASLIVGFLVLSYGRYARQIAQTASTTPTATTASADSANLATSLADQIDDNLGRMLSTSAVRLVLAILLLALAVGMGTYAPNRVDQRIFLYAAWAHMGLCAVLALAGIARFAYSPEIPTFEWLVYAVMTIFLGLLAVILTYMAGNAENCQRFAWILLGEVGLHIVVLVFLHGLLLGLVFLANLGYLILLIVLALILLYLGKMMTTLFLAERTR